MISLETSRSPKRVFRVVVAMVIVFLLCEDSVDEVITTGKDWNKVAVQML